MGRRCAGPGAQPVVLTPHGDTTGRTREQVCIEAGAYAEAADAVLKLRLYVALVL